MCFDKEKEDLHLKNKVFHYNGLKIELHPEVYEPAEDTFQVLEAIKINGDEKVLEIGAGSGLISLECARQGARVVCTDINPYACEYVELNFLKNSSLIKGNLKVRKGDLFSPIKKDEKFDIIIFNPPYLPTNSDERVGGSGWFDIATDGGKDGLDATKRFISEVKNYVHKDGLAYFVFSSLSNREKLDFLLSKAQLNAKVVLSRLYDDEYIDIYCIHF